MSGPEPLHGLADSLFMEARDLGPDPFGPTTRESCGVMPSPVMIFEYGTVLVAVCDGARYGFENRRSLGGPGGGSAVIRAHEKVSENNQ